MLKNTKQFLIVLILLFSLVPIYFANAQGPVIFSDFSVENHFPQDAIFRAKVSSGGAQIVTAQFVFSSDGFYSTDSYTKRTVNIQPGQEVDLAFIWLTGGGTSLPWSYITYYWDVVDADGNHYRSEQQSFRYDDIRFDWDVLESGNTSVWWHDRPASFGQGVFEIAVRAVRDQRDVFQVDLEYPVRIVIYNTFQEYAEFQGIAHEWVGGQTYSDYGVTVQIVENSTYQNSWLLDVIPHEISHLYFAQAAHNPTVSIPTWLNEGVAQYNEYTDHVWEANNVRSAAKRGELIPLSLLANGFGAYNEERIYLAYNESWSAVNYFAETYGEASLGVLLAAYKQGKMTDEAFLAAIGKDAGAFETEWAQYLGVPDDYVTPTPWALPTFRSAPTMFVRGQTAATQEPTVEPVFTPTALPDDPTPSQTNFPCVSFAPALALGLGVVIYRQKRQPK